MRYRLLCSLVTVTLCNNLVNAKLNPRRSDIVPLLPSHYELNAAIRLSGGAIETQEDERKDLRKAFFGGSRYYDSLAHRLADGRIREAVLSTERLAKRSAKYVPSIFTGAVAVLCSPDRSGLSFFSIFILTLLGTSVGFHTFLYFISVGYGTGIGIPVALLLLCNNTPTVLVKVLHSALVLVWSLRMVTFLLWRELVNWPALHKKLSQVNSQQSPDTLIKVLCWIFYSMAYFCVASPCWFSIQSTNDVRGLTSWLGVLLQTSGLVLESIADWQKSSFKASTPSNRYRWCREGLWKYSTHPNYAGEWFFWLGTFIVGLDIVIADTQKTALTKLLQTVVMITGFVFITATFRMNVTSLDHRLEEKYGEGSDYDIGFPEFKRQYSIFGPRWWKNIENSDTILNIVSRYNLRLTNFFGTMSNNIETLQTSSSNITNALVNKMKSLLDFSPKHNVTINTDSSAVIVSQNGNSSDTTTTLDCPEMSSDSLLMSHNN